MSAAEPRTFSLPPNGAVQLAFVVGGLSLVAALTTTAMFGAGFLVFTAGAGPAVFLLLSGVPKQLDVYPDRVVIRYALKADRTIPTNELMVQRLPGELMLVHESDSYVFDEESFAPGLIEACGDAIAEVAHEVVEREQTRPLH